MIVLRGQVIQGENIGRRLGYPTANLSRRVLGGRSVSRGVYLAVVKYKYRWYQALAIIGVPGIRRQKKGKVEIYLLNFRGNLYGQQLTAVLLRKLRKMRQFREEKALKQQIEKDIRRAKQYFKKSWL